MEAVFSARDASLRQAGLDSDTIRFLRHPDRDLLEFDLRWLKSRSHRLVTWGSDDYPALLGLIDSPPAAFFAAGDPGLLWQPQIAIVGSRNPTRGGLDNARDFAAEVSRRGFAVTSGLASGIDSAAHDAALDSGGRTVAVLGTGLDRVYPASSRRRAAAIVESGVLVSELPPGTPALRQHFPSRNRIIAGLSLGVLVVEAGLNSGSLITARLASEQGRDVFALPGSIHNPMSKGCHRLIREGARLVENVGEIIDGIGPMAGELANLLRERLGTCGAAAVDNAATQPKMLLAPEEAAEPDPDYQRLWDKLGYDPKPVDRLVEQSGLTARDVSAMLLILELKGKVEAHPGGAFSRRQ